MEYKDYYKILGVKKTSGKDELKKQYRKLARQYHPDVNTADKSAGARFGEISEAYEVLSDDEKRKKYDALGSDWEKYQNSEHSDNFDWTKYSSPGTGSKKGGNTNQNWEDIFGNGSGASDFFRNIFGQGFGNYEGAQHGGAQFVRKGQDLSAELAVSLEEAYAGGVKILSLGDKKIRLTLKPGIWDRQTIKIAGKGAPGSNGGEPGDLFITFLHKPHPEYLLNGVNLYKDIPVSIYSAILGTSMEIETISGKLKIKIPPETKNGTVLKLKGKGFPTYGKSTSHGNLYLKVVLQLPEKLSTREQKLFRELAAIRNEKVREETK